MIKQAGLAVSVAIGSALLLTSASRAQQALPPPPSIANDNALPSLTPVTAPVSGAAAFPGVAPYSRQSMPSPTPVAPLGIPGSYAPSYQTYQVVVNGDSPYLLQQIQLTERSASVQNYQGRRVIQAGSFSSQAEAQQRVALLAQQGVAAQVVSASSSANQMGMSAPEATAPVMPHFQVVVPSRPEQFATIANKMTSMGVKPEAIQAKRAPLGPHLAVGPFTNPGEAESVSTYLRTGGMDARVYYAK